MDGDGPEVALHTGGDTRAVTMPCLDARRQPFGPKVEDVGTSTVALVKHPRPAAEFDRQAVLARLFALPIPPLPSSRRSYPIHMPLGRIMRLQGKQKRDIAAAPGCPNERSLTEMLAGRRELREYRVPIAAALGVDPRVL